jgi:glycine/serine hydroxymethyltransferase
MHVIAAKAVAFKEALQPSYKKYAEMVVSNAQTLSDTLIRGPHFYLLCECKSRKVRSNGGEERADAQRHANTTRI